MIEVRNLTKCYGTVKAVDDISFDVASGEVVGFLGPNGAGKTTTMRVLTGYMGRDAGSVKIDGREIAEDYEGGKARIGYLPENNPIYEDITVVEYLDFIGEVRGLPKGPRRESIRDNLKLYGLDDVATRDIGELSKGYRQRVGLAQAALHDPPIMILDEPTSGLDPNQIIEIRNLIRNIGMKKTVILSTHNLSEVEATCSRILIINKGKIVADDTPDALTQGTKGDLIHVRFKNAAGTFGDTLGRLRGVRTVSKRNDDEGGSFFTITADPGLDMREPVFDLAVEKGWKILELRRERESLEDIFTKLTRG